MSPNTLGLLVSAAILMGGAALVAILWYLTRVSAQRRVRRRLAEPVPTSEFETVAGEGAVLAKMAETGKALEEMIDTEGESGTLLAQAGWRGARARLLFYAFQALCPVVALVLVGIIWLFGGKAVHGILVLLLAVIGLVLSLLAPRWLLRRRAARRRARIQAEVPLLVHLLVLLFEAGLSTRQAIASLVREGRGVLPELGDEFLLVLRQLEAGGDTAEVLRYLGDQMAVPDLTSILGVLRQVDRYGGEVRAPLMEALTVIEERRSLDLRERVNLMSGRMTVVMVMFFFPALLFFVAGPAFVSIIKALAKVNQ